MSRLAAHTNSPMTPHSVLFNTIVDRDDLSRTTSPAGMSSRSSPISSSSMLRPSNSYWGGDRSPPLSSTGRAIGRDYPYSQYRTEVTSPLDHTLPRPTRSSSEDYGRQSGPSNPTIDFSGLIPMYGEPGSPSMDSRGQLLDLPYEHEWPTSNMGQYATFQRNKPTLWSSEDHLSPQQWNSSLSSGSSLTQHFNEYVPYSPPSPYSSTTSSSPSPSYFLTPTTTPNASSRPSTSRRSNTDPDAPKKSCFHCHRNKLRPQELIDADIDDDDTPQIPDEEYTGPKCSHCLTRQTSVWRRSKTGAQVCNACGVYARLRGKERPLSLRRNKIKPRTKHSR
ncbi:hypothetical protein B0H11DRAFT_2134285 [Mycena galericulata]|nr:hypothetical protein B0H11DRAFT_2134285 [Mycena galericulata]